MMRYWSIRKLTALVLAVFVAAAMGLSAAQASGTTTKMATMIQMDMSHHGGCQGNSDNASGGGLKATACCAVCTTLAIAPLPEATHLTISGAPVSFASQEPLLHGRTSPPDPYPPRTSNIG